VYVLYDVSSGDVCEPPAWLEEEGFEKLEGNTVVINTQRRSMGTIRFQLYMKRVAENIVCRLGGNKAEGSAHVRNNYVVFVLKGVNLHRRSSGVTLDPDADEEAVGVLLYDPPKPKICVCVGDEEDSWSKQVRGRGRGGWLFDSPEAHVNVSATGGRVGGDRGGRVRDRWGASAV
jgi:hypothetical protein